MGLEEFLRYAQGAGINAIVGFILSFVVEYWPAYDNLPPRKKRLVVGAFCFVIPVAALLAKVALGYELIDRNTLWSVLVNGFAAFTGSQAAHLRSLKSE